MSWFTVTARDIRGGYAVGSLYPRKEACGERSLERKLDIFIPSKAFDHRRIS